jgi:hypothetical protein
MPENPDLFPADWTKPGGPRHRWEFLWHHSDSEVSSTLEGCINCDVCRQRNNSGKWRYFAHRMSRLRSDVGDGWTYKRPCCIHPELRRDDRERGK